MKQSYSVTFLAKIITTLLFIIVVVQSGQRFSFSRKMNCVEIGPNGHCKQWNQTTVLYRYSNLIYYCFSADTYVLTSNGPKQMKNLKVKDQIFGFNINAGKNGFTPIISWLHHDPLSLYQYSLIEVQNSDHNFLASKYHNIGFGNSSQTQFKFVKDLAQNDSLITFSLHNVQLKVKDTQKKIQKQGLYSPFTQSGTFYIFPSDFNEQKYKQNQSEYPMILVHSLSQIKNPIQNYNTALNYLKTTNSILGSYQPQQQQQYVNSLLSTFNILFGNDWVKTEEQQKLAYRIHQSVSHQTTTSSNNGQKQARKRKTMAVLAMNSILADTLY